MAADRRLVAATSALLLAAACCAAREDIVTTSRAGAATDGTRLTVEQSYLLDTPDSASPGAVLLVLPGGNGNINLRREASLWFYAANDSFFDPEQVQRSFDAYRKAGGEQAQLVKVDAFKRDGHGLFADPDGVPLWWPQTEKFLLEIGMLK